MRKLKNVLYQRYNHLKIKLLKEKIQRHTNQKQDSETHKSKAGRMKHTKEFIPLELHPIPSTVDFPLTQAPFDYSFFLKTSPGSYTSVFSKPMQAIYPSILLKSLSRLQTPSSNYHLTNTTRHCSHA